MPSSSQLTQRITLQLQSSTQDALGQSTEVWQPVATVWAEVLPQRGRDLQAAGATVAQSTVRVTVRARPGLSSRMRIVWGGVAYDVQGEWMQIERGWMRCEAASAVRDAAHPVV